MPPRTTRSNKGSKRGPRLPYRIGEMPFGVGTPPPRKTRSNKGKHRPRKHVVLNNKGDEVLNMISLAPIPKEHVITVQKQEYDARALMRWFDVSKSYMVPHTKDTLTNHEVGMVYYRAKGFRHIIVNLNKSLRASLRHKLWPEVANHFRDIEFYYYLGFHDYSNKPIKTSKVTMGVLRRNRTQKDEFQLFLKNMSQDRFLMLHSLRDFLGLKRSVVPQSPIIVN